MSIHLQFFQMKMDSISEIIAKGIVMMANGNANIVTRATLTGIHYAKVAIA